MNRSLNNASNIDSELRQLAYYDVTKGLMPKLKDGEDSLRLQERTASKFNYFKRLIQNGECDLAFIRQTVLEKNGPFYGTRRPKDEEEKKPVKIPKKVDMRTEAPPAAANPKQACLDVDAMPKAGKRTLLFIGLLCLSTFLYFKMVGPDSEFIEASSKRFAFAVCFIPTIIFGIFALPSCIINARKKKEDEPYVRFDSNGDLLESLEFNERILEGSGQRTDIS